MNIFSTVVSDVKGIEKTVVGWLVKEYSAFYKKEPTIVAIVDSTVQYAEIGLPIVLGMVGEPALVPAIESIMEEAVSDLKVVSATVYDFGPSPNAASILTSVQGNLASLETAGHIKDPAALAKLKLIVNAVGALAAIIVKAIAGVQTPVPVAA